MLFGHCGLTTGDYSLSFLKEGMVTRSAAGTPTWGVFLCFLQCVLSSDNHLDLPVGQPRCPGLPSMQWNVKSTQAAVTARLGCMDGCKSIFL